MFMRLSFIACTTAFVMAAAGCSSLAPEPQFHAGTGTMKGTLPTLALETNTGVAVSRSFPPSTEIKIGASGVACESLDAGDRITIDIGAAAPGVYTLVKGYPNKADLSTAQARAHACPANSNDTAVPCHNLVKSGTVTITRFDGGKGGIIEGTFQISFADGDVSGTFSALRCT